jgi:AcrR family transcriptional regulator
MSPRPNVSEERKTQILEAAETIIAAKGITSARMDDIAAETGLSKGTLYLYFKNKGELVAALFERIFRGVLSQIAKRNDAQESATEAIMNFTEAAIRDYLRMLKILPIAYDFLALAFRNSVIQKALKGYFRKFTDTMVPIIRNGVDSGEFRAINPEDTAIAMGAIYEGTLLLWIYDRASVDIERHIRSGILLLLEGMKATR